MASDYTIIMAVRHRFGVDEHSYPWTKVLNEDRNAPFVGLVGEFPFNCPNVDLAQGAVLEFEYRGSTQYTSWFEPGGRSGLRVVRDQRGIPGADKRSPDRGRCTRSPH